MPGHAFHVVSGPLIVAFKGSEDRPGESSGFSLRLSSDGQVPLERCHVSAFGHGRDDVEHRGEDESVTSEMGISMYEAYCRVHSNLNKTDYLSVSPRYTCPFDVQYHSTPSRSPLTFAPGGRPNPCPGLASTSSWTGPNPAWYDAAFTSVDEFFHGNRVNVVMD